jgi:uncharacterized protein YhaN
LLRKGINVIYGANEAGKSTLQWFIRGMLYGLKGGRASKDGIPPPVKRLKPWSGGQYGGSLEYRLDDGTLVRVERNFDSNTVAVYDENFNNITNTLTFQGTRVPCLPRNSWASTKPALKERAGSSDGNKA